MAHVIQQDPRDFIKRFTPLYQVDRKFHSQLASDLKLITVKAGETIIRKTRTPSLLHFLIEGDIEVRESFEVRYNVSHDDQICGSALEAKLPKQATIKAASACTLLAANANQLDQYLSWSQDYSIFYLDEGEMTIEDVDLIDDNFQEDWDNVFIRSKLAANLPNRAIHQLLSQLEDVEVTTGECVVKANTPGDYFYILKQGFAEVKTLTNGPFKGQSFSLEPGNYFGDEALVAETLRNASVTMSSDGLLGRLPLEAFNHLVKQYLVSPLTEDIDPNAKHVKVIDVRLPLEYKLGHDKNSINLPISFLRQRMDEMKETSLYVMSPADDRRAELATYLMRQAGFEAYCMSKQN